MSPGVLLYPIDNIAWASPNDDDYNKLGELWDDDFVLLLDDSDPKYCFVLSKFGCCYLVK
jgi:hypothetical protein